MTGNPAALAENPAPEREPLVMVTAAVPLDVTVTVLVAVVPTGTLPNASEVGFTLSEGEAEGVS